MFGSNGHIKHPEGGIVNNFTKRLKYDGTSTGPYDCDANFTSIHVKNISRIDKIHVLNIHEQNPYQGHCIRSDGTVISPATFDEISEEILSTSVLHLNHYAIQSREFFETIKQTRGDNVNVSNDHVRNNKYFLRYDWNHLIDDELKIKRLKILGFIILRHVRTKLHNHYWIQCYHSIRKFYPENPIMIIDDNSNPSHVSIIDLYKTNIIHSEFPGRGELLPYYYFYTNKFCDTAVILQDSVFLQKKLDFASVKSYQPLWTFATHDYDQPEDEEPMIDLFHDLKIKEFYSNKSSWNGCFGGMSIITYEYLDRLHKNFDFRQLLNHVLTRYNRMSFERVIACVLQFFSPNGKMLGFIGDIHEYLFKFNIYFGGIEWENRDQYPSMPIVKIWSSR
jgi:hypothetical protein